jgi:formate/nitrite transporter FocA (FNT family)
VFYALAANTTTLAIVLDRFFLPTLIGNAIGGVAFVAALNYAQVSPDKSQR